MPVARTFLVGIALSLAAANAPVLAADGGVEFADTLEQRLLACSGCHGKQGEGSRQNEYYPRIAGKPAQYLFRQLVNFREGKRTNPQMIYFTRYLSDEYLMEIATFYSKQKPPFPTPIQPAATKQQLSRGEALVRQGDKAKGIPACAACHGTRPVCNQAFRARSACNGITSSPRWCMADRIRHATELDCMAKIAAAHRRRRLFGRCVSRLPA
jgi:cytochrome c553